MKKPTYYLGIDIGSTASKVVIVSEDQVIVGQGLFASGAGTQGPENALHVAMQDANVAQSDIKRICATGYGRKIFKLADENMSELSCHAKGASMLFPGARTVIDIGGQDAKVLKITSTGSLEQFVMNDKCAAGTGRFLDVMATVFGCNVSDLSDYDFQSTEIAPISSTCTVFAESEVISKLAMGITIPNIIAGIHTSVAERTAGLVRRVGICSPVVMTGGVSLNTALRMRLQEKIGEQIETSHNAQFAGAIGAALYAREHGMSE